MNKIAANTKLTFIKEIWQKFPWFLLLIPVFYLIQTFIIYHGDISIISILKQLLIWELSFSGIIAIFLLLKPLKKYTALLISFLAILYFYFNRIYAAASTGFTSLLIHSYTNFIICCLILCLLVLFYFRMKPTQLPGFVKWIKITYIITTLYFIVQGIFFLFNKKEYNLSNYKPKVQLLKNNLSEKQLPNIYFIVPDSYTSNSILQTNFNYNNSAMNTFLQQQGFFIADSSASNYFYSPVSIAATLNLDYLPKAHSPKDQNDLILFSGLRLIEKANLLQFLNSCGYQIYNLSPFTILNTRSKLLIHYYGSSDEDLIKYNTIESVNLRYLAQSFLSKITGKQRKTEIEENTNKKRADMQTISDYITTLSTSNNKKPNFIYVHTALPHPPHVIDSTGAYLDPEFRMDTSRIGYIRQLAFVNVYLKKWVTQIRKNDSSAIIIIQGDHGFRAFPKEQNKTDAFKILNAIYFPNKDYKDLYSTISSVNTFRLVLNKYFHQNLPLLKDSSFFPKF